MTMALELALWYQFLHDCLHNEVKHSLTEGIVRNFLARSEPIEELYFVAHVLECLQSKPQHIIDVDFVDVIDSMMGMFYDQFPNESALMASSLSSFSGGLSRFLDKFLRLQDCFYYRTEGPYLEISFDFQFADWALKASGDVMWQPPSVRFLHVPTKGAIGETYRITPYVWPEVVSPPGGDGSSVERVDYEILRSQAKFTWDPAKNCFNAVIRNSTPHSFFPDTCSLEFLRDNSPKDFTVASDGETVLHSPQKRKMSKPEIAAKRRRGNELHESFLQEVVQYARRNRVALKHPRDRRPPQHGNAQPVETQCDNGHSSLPQSPVLSDSTTSDDAAIPKRGSLNQEDILRNYHDFADRRRMKDAGLVISPVSDGERRAFESIFVGESDGWSPSSDVRSQDMDATLSDEQ
ncbi:hypothetical protein SLS61_007638 [Didymella pomorum]